MALEPLLIARPTPGSDADAGVDGVLLPALANRHGLIAGATGTGKTVTLQRIVEQFSRIGVPTLLADVKGDLSGLAAAGQEKAVFSQRREQLGLPPATFAACPVEFWDVLGDQGHPLRATISELGPILLTRLLNLNDTQAGVLTIAFRLADDQGLLLLDLKDLQELLRHLSENAREYQSTYGNISAASVGAIQRGLLALEQQAADRFFGEPSLNVMDLLQTDGAGHGVVNILAADQLVQAPKLYATVMLWLLSQLYEQLPEVGDAEKPKLLVIFDEAHLLFDGAPPVLVEKVEQVVRLIRSKGVGLYFCTQNPLDLPPKVLGQLSNRVQHALRAFTPQEQKAVKAAATTFRPNPPLDVEAAIGELAVGEALVSFLDDKGAPTPVERALVVPRPCTTTTAKPRTGNRPMNCCVSGPPMPQPPRRLRSERRRLRCGRPKRPSRPKPWRSRKPASSSAGSGPNSAPRSGRQPEPPLPLPARRSACCSRWPARPATCSAVARDAASPGG